MKPVNRGHAGAGQGERWPRGVYAEENVVLKQMMIIVVIDDV